MKARILNFFRSIFSILFPISDLSLKISNIFCLESAYKILWQLVYICRFLWIATIALSSKYYYTSWKDFRSSRVFLILTKDIGKVLTYNNFISKHKTGIQRCTAEGGLIHAFQESKPAEAV